MPNSHDPYFLLIYSYSDDYLEKRASHRKQHFKQVEELVEKGYLILGGALEILRTVRTFVFNAPTGLQLKILSSAILMY